MVAGDNSEDVAAVVREAKAVSSGAPQHGQRNIIKLKELFVTEGLKMVFVIMAALLVAALLLWLGLK